MADKKPEFTVTDRRLFTPEGEVRADVAENGERAAVAEQPPKPAGKPPEASAPAQREPQEAPLPPPTADEQSAQAEAYSKSVRDMDSRLGKEFGAEQVQDLEVTFERFLASIYMTALMQLGLAHEQGGSPRIDLIGARQSIDSISLLQQKTKGNLTDREESFLQNMLYELRMAYLEVTNALAQGPGPQAQGGPAGPRGR